MNRIAIFPIIVVLALCFLTSCELTNGGTDEEEYVLGVTDELLAFPLQEKIALSWISVPDAESYNLFWTDDGSEPSESSQKISVLAVSQTEHENLDYTKTYNYKLQAVNGAMKGRLSPTTSAKPEPGLLHTPAGLAASVEGQSISLIWDAVSVNGIVYYVKRKCPAKEFYYTTIGDQIAEATYTDGDYFAGQGCYYKISAYDAMNQRSSEDSEPIYVVSRSDISEHERNNEDIPSTLEYDTHFYDAEEITEYLDWFTIEGAYSGSFSMYSASAYKNFDSDCFLISLNEGDKVLFNLIEGNMSGLWSMSVDVIEYGKNNSGNNREVYSHSFTETDNSFVYQMSSTGTVYGTYLRISMWDDLINTGPYNYKLEFQIERQP